MDNTHYLHTKFVQLDFCFLYVSSTDFAYCKSGCSDKIFQYHHINFLHVKFYISFECVDAQRLPQY